MERWPSQKGVSPSRRERRSWWVSWERRVVAVWAREEPDFRADRASVNVYSLRDMVVVFSSFKYAVR